MDLRQQRVALETDRHRIEGTITLPREGYRSRVSDFVNQREREFFSLRDALVSPLDGSAERRIDFLLVARAHVRLIDVVEGEGD